MRGLSGMVVVGFGVVVGCGFVCGLGSKGWGSSALGRGLEGLRGEEWDCGGESEDLYIVRLALFDSSTDLVVLESGQDSLCLITIMIVIIVVQ